MVEGKMEVTMKGKPKILGKGDEVFFPPNVKHTAKTMVKSRGIVFISGKGLFKPKSTR